MPRIPLPPPLATAPFLVRSAEAEHIGLGRLRGPDLKHPHHGIRTTELNGVWDYVPLLRAGERFSHTTAAALWGLPLPRLGQKIHVSVPSTPESQRSPSRGISIVGHRSTYGGFALRHGLPVTDAARLFIELGTLLSEDDLVAVGDALVLDPAVLDPYDIRPWVTVEELLIACERSRSPGCRRARRALARVRQGAESRTETLLRLLILGAGLPEPQLGVDVFDKRGLWIGRFDLVYAAERVIVEYDGEQHRTKDAQYDKDQIRIRRASAAGWTVVRVRWRGLFERQDETIAEVREALSARVRGS